MIFLKIAPELKRMLDDFGRSFGINTRCTEK